MIVARPIVGPSLVEVSARHEPEVERALEPVGAFGEPVAKPEPQTHDRWRNDPRSRTDLLVANSRLRGREALRRFERGVREERRSLD